MGLSEEGVSLSEELAGEVMALFEEGLLAAGEAMGLSEEGSLAGEVAGEEMGLSEELAGEAAMTSF